MQKPSAISPHPVFKVVFKTVSYDSLSRLVCIWFGVRLALLRHRCWRFHKGAQILTRTFSKGKGLPLFVLQSKCLQAVDTFGNNSKHYLETINGQMYKALWSKF